MDPIVSSVNAEIQAVLPPLSFYIEASPIFILFAGALAALLVGIFRGSPDRANYSSYLIALFSCLGACIVPALWLPYPPTSYLAGGFLADGISRFSFLLIAFGTLFVFLCSSRIARGRLLLKPESTALLLLSASGMMTMVAAGEFVSFFVGLELMSVPLYVLVGYQRNCLPGIEAGMKYFLYGATAAGVMTMGMALIYMHTGSMTWDSLRYLRLSTETPFAILGAILFISGMVFKLGLVPFHQWVPDIYQGAHSLLTGFMSALVKASMVLVIYRILNARISDEIGVLSMLFWILGVLSIFVGSLFGLVHNSVKRLLAYSSVANAGYFCLAFLSLSTDPSSQTSRHALAAFAVIYALATLGAFVILAWIEDGNREDLLKEELSGFGYKHPYISTLFTIFLLSLAGLPPFAGFFGKWMLINSAVSSGFIGISIIMVVLSCISLYYYLSVLVSVWLRPESKYTVTLKSNEDAKGIGRLVTFVAVLVVVIGLFGPRWVSLINYQTAQTQAQISK